MKTDIPDTYAIAEYLLVIEPNKALQEAIMQVKKYFGEKFDCAAAVTGKPNISLLRFKQYEMIEQRILRRMELLAAQQESFLIELDDYGSLPTHGIFLNVTTKNQFIELVKSLRPIQYLFKIDKERKPHFITDPHITIARKLLPWQYEKGWLEMSHTHFNGKFMADHLLLLRKREGQNKFETIKKFQLLNVKVCSVQGELFA